MIINYNNSYKGNLFLCIMNKKEFKEAKEKYLSQKSFFEKILKGQLVWETIGRGFDMDYHPAVVREVNIDENYVDVIDVSDNNQEKRYYAFITEEEMINEGFSKEDIKGEYQRYSKTIEEVLKK